MLKGSLFAILILPCVVYAQIGGQRSFELLNIPANTRLMGLGGVNVSLADQDINLLFSNPSLVGDTLAGCLSVSYLDYFANTGMTSVAYAHNFKQYGTWFFGFSHFNLGNIEGFDELGEEIGSFSSGETVFLIGHSHQVGPFRLGGNLKVLLSQIAGFNASAMAVDLGGVFIHPTRDLNVGIVLKNIGFVLGEYSETSASRLPFDLQVGASFKPMYMPIRFSLTAYNLHEGDIAFFDPNNNLPNEEEPGIADKVLRHLVFGAELLIGKNLNVRFGYNHLIRRELRLEQTSGGAGFSFGLMFRVKSFEFSYSRGGYHAAGAANSFTLTTNTNALWKRKNA